MGRFDRAAVVLAWSCVLGVPLSASAANGNKPRVPVNWTPAECAQIVDRSATTTVHFDYTVPSEEDPDDRTADEVDDSRTHQFFAFRKQDAKAELPTWITHADIQRSSLVDPEVVDADIDPQDVLETTSRFTASDWVRITPDDARVPITFAQADLGVDWDLTAVEPGTYRIHGYTWEPIRNLWSARQGFVKVIASAAAAADAGPSVALTRDEVQLTAGTAYTLPGCVDVADGSTITVEWGAVVGTAEPAWQVATQDEPVTSGALAVEFVPPDEAGGMPIRLRVTVTDAEGRTDTSFSPTVLPVAVNPNPDEGDDDGGGGGCAVAPRVSPSALLLLLVLPAWVRRRNPSPR